MPTGTHAHAAGTPSTRSAPGASSFPFSDETRDAEYDANGHYAIGPALAQPSSLVRMIADARASEPPNVAKTRATAQIAADRAAYRQSLPAPKRGMTALVAALKAA